MEEEAPTEQAPAKEAQSEGVGETTDEKAPPVVMPDQAVAGVPPM